MIISFTLDILFNFSIEIFFLTFFSNKNNIFKDFDVNARGTINLLEMTKNYCFDAPFIFMSTNKVYGDNPNKLPLVEKSTRWEIKNNHSFKKQIS